MGRRTRSPAGTNEPPRSREATLADVLLGSLDDAATRELAERLRPHLPPAPARLLDAREAAALVGLHPDTLVRMARSGRVWAQKAGREWRFRADRLEILPRGGEASPTWHPVRAARVRATTPRPSVA